LIEPGRNTGHAFIVVDDPELLDGGVVSIRAYDLSYIRHYDDTRGRGGESLVSGLGCECIDFRYRDSGIEFQFGPGDQYHECALGIGRLEPLAI
jgi:hypothetical protein